MRYPCGRRSTSAERRAIRRPEWRRSGLAARRGEQVRAQRQFGDVELLVPERALENLLRPAANTVESAALDRHPAIQQRAGAIRCSGRQATIPTFRFALQPISSVHATLKQSAPATAPPDGRQRLSIAGSQGEPRRARLLIGRPMWERPQAAALPLLNRPCRGPFTRSYSSPTPSAGARRRLGENRPRHASMRDLPLPTCLAPTS